MLHVHQVLGLIVKKGIKIETEKKRGSNSFPQEEPCSCGNKRLDFLQSEAL